MVLCTRASHRRRLLQTEVRVKATTTTMMPTTEGGEFDDDVAGVLCFWGPSKSPVPFFPSVEVKTQQALNPLSHGRQTLWVEKHLQAPIVKAKKQQSKDVQNEFNMRLTQVRSFPISFSFILCLFDCTNKFLKFDRLIKLLPSSRNKA
ncbi:uncharacterized protein LOC133817669 isoform X1 [Humulus lupulus]|uniref:uncharacterized protein LOC133817669 isoform X1 n=1 Tax=Humulus lupulus TaxID=3486 RepID=UPI002B404F9C|nr:uncharacterized protein LOC133817669 isoform X1 [Humulus lupulus]